MPARRPFETSPLLGLQQEGPGRRRRSLRTAGWELYGLILMIAFLVIIHVRYQAGQDSSGGGAVLVRVHPMHAVAVGNNMGAVPDLAVVVALAAGNGTNETRSNETRGTNETRPTQSMKRVGHDPR